MNRDDTRKAAETMLAWASGKEVEARTRIEGAEWYRVEAPLWDWSVTEYRIKPEPREFYIVRARDGSKALAFDQPGPGRILPVVTKDPCDTEVIRVREVTDDE